MAFFNESVFCTKVVECEYVPCDSIVPENFKVIQNPIVCYVLPLLPWLSMFIIILLLTLYTIKDLYTDKLLFWVPIIISAYFVAGTVLFAQSLFMKKIPETFRKLWCRKIIVKYSSSDSSQNNTGSKCFKDIASPYKSLEVRFSEFIDEMQKRLNNLYQWIIGIFFVSMTFLWNPLNTLIFTSPMDKSWVHIKFWQELIDLNWHLFNAFQAIIIAFVLGLMVWKMIATSISVSDLMEKFQVEPRLGHPDKAGGLAPLGYLCLWNCIIATMPAIYFSLWLSFGNLNKYGGLYGMTNYYIYEFLILLLISCVIPFYICFIWPVWKVHQQMNEWRDSKSERLYQIGHSIHQFESKLLNETEKLNWIERKSLLKQLEEMKQIYTQNEKLPLWPFNIAILGKLSLTYIIPLLTFINQVNSLMPYFLHH